MCAPVMCLLWQAFAVGARAPYPSKETLACQRPLALCTLQAVDLVPHRKKKHVTHTGPPSHTGKMLMERVSPTPGAVTPSSGPGWVVHASGRRYGGRQWESGSAGMTVTSSPRTTCRST